MPKPIGFLVTKRGPLGVVGVFVRALIGSIRMGCGWRSFGLALTLTQVACKSPWEHSRVSRQFEAANEDDKRALEDVRSGVAGPYMVSLERQEDAAAEENSPT